MMKKKKVQAAGAKAKSRHQLLMVARKRRWCSIRRMKTLLFLLSAAVAQAQLVDVPDLGLRVQRGFRVSVFSDE